MARPRKPFKKRHPEFAGKKMKVKLLGPYYSAGVLYPVGDVIELVGVKPSSVMMCLDPKDAKFVEDYEAAAAKPEAPAVPAAVLAELEHLRKQVADLLGDKSKK